MAGIDSSSGGQSLGGEWRTHTSAKPQLGGYAELLQANDEAGRFAAVLRILQKVEPGRRGLSVAVIVQTNDTSARLADYLRRVGGLPALAESDQHIALDNPLTTALLALCVWPRIPVIPSRRNISQ